MISSLDEPPRGSRAIAESVTPSTDSDLVAALNHALSNGDGFVTFALYGETLDDDSIVGIDWTDGEPGPTLTLQVSRSATGGETLIFDFDGNDPAPWTAVQISNAENGPTELGAISTEDPTVGNSVPPEPLTAPAFVGPVPFEAENGDNTRDQAHQTLVYRSPEFEIAGNGEISFALIGGAKPGFDIDAINENGLPAESDGNGSIGVALRNASTGAYLTFDTRAENGSQSWETIILGSDVLGQIVEPGESYTLDFIDYHSGGWGWAGLDNAIIRPGTPSAVEAAITSVAVQAGSIVIEYTGRLEASSSVTGDWTPVENASTPYTEAVSGDSKFFRVVE